VVSLSVVEGRPIRTLAALAAAGQRWQQLHSTMEDRRARARERTCVQHLAQHVEQHLSLAGHSAGTGSSSPARGGGFEQPYGAQAQERGGAGGAQAPLNCQLIATPLFISGCKDQNGSEMVAQEQFRRNAAPLNCSLHMTHSY
jgi:hypothetical protein